MAPIKVNGNVLDLDSDHPDNVLFSEDASAEGSNYILVQTTDSLSKQEMAELSEAGASFQEYVADNTYLYYYQPSDLQPIRGKSFVKKAGIYPKGVKVNAHLRSSANEAPQGTRTIHAILHREKDQDISAIVPDIARAAGISENDIAVNGNKIRMDVGLEGLDSLAAVDSVRTIEDAPEDVIYNNFARSVLDADVILNNTPYQGKGQIVVVADTGLDKGDKNNVHPAFSGRVKELIPVGRPSETNDTIGHGTHVCGSVLGGSLSVSENGFVAGMAPQAELVVQSLVNELKGLFPPKGSKLQYTLSGLFLGPFKKYQDACIHTNSWGPRWGGSQLPYSDTSSEVDQCMWDNPELLICYAAGNDGHQSSTPTLGDKAAAKNCLTIGASESTRPSQNGVFNASNKVLNDPTKIAWFSSGGPTVEGRIKPDVVAPGTAILSAKSRDAPVSNKFGTSPDPQWMFDTGTSMATPLVAGCAAVLREALVKNGTPKPTSALLKALLINGAFSLRNADPGRAGFGLVDLQNSIIIPGKTANAGFVMAKPLTDKGQANEFSVTAPSKVDKLHDKMTGPRISAQVAQGVTLKVTLAYTDLPSAQLQNNLNLIVTASNGTTQHGNKGSSSDFDNLNNVEQIVWKGIPPGQAKISVQAERIVTAQQDYALVWQFIPSEN